MRSLFPLATVGLLLALAASSQQPADSKKPARPNLCPNANTTLEINECLGDLQHKAAASLNALYQKIQKAIRERIAQEQGPLKGYGERSLEKLRVAENAWIHYRDAQCDAAEQQFEGGTISTSVRLGCMKDLDEQRTRELEETYAIYLRGAP
jgi:uncharacterized protein YecT (DUF1311 family)